MGCTSSGVKYLRPKISPNSFQTKMKFIAAICRSFLHFRYSLNKARKPSFVARVFPLPRSGEGFARRVEEHKTCKNAQKFTTLKMANYLQIKRKRPK